MIEEARKHLKVYRAYFVQYWKSRMVYSTDFLINIIGRLVSVSISLGFLSLIFTQIDSLQGWSFNEMLFLAGFGGIILNLHHIFGMNVYRLGQNYIRTGDFDRFMVRPLNPLFQIYADDVNDSNIAKLATSIGLVVYSSYQLGLEYGLWKLLYAVPAVVSGIMVFAATFLTFASTAFWTGRSRATIWILFQLSDFRRYPFGIYNIGLQILLTTLIPIAFATFFPATYFLERGQWGLWQILSLFAGPVFYFLSYQFWKLGLGNYSSTGS